MLMLGAHMSISGGLEKAIDHAISVESDAVQVFTKNQRQWNARPISDDEAALFRSRYAESGLKGVVAHDSYLINLASPKDDLWEKSIAAFKDELERCELLQIPYLVTHPGSHTGSGREAGLDRIAAALERVHNDLPGFKVRTLLETTAGQGTNLGSTFEDIAYLLEHTHAVERVGVCFDTCHAFVAGYDIRTPETYADTIDDFDRTVGLSQIEAFHFNDAKAELGSKKDRHHLIGQGYIGVEGFRNFMNDSRFDGKPALLETDKGDDLAEDRAALQLLRSLVS